MRTLFGRTNLNMPSRFLQEIPEEITEVVGGDADGGYGYGGAGSYGRAGYGGASGYGRSRGYGGAGRYGGSRGADDWGAGDEPDGGPSWGRRGGAARAALR